jgi:hypothetical protein
VLSHGRLLRVETEPTLVAGKRRVPDTQTVWRPRRAVT